MSSFNLFILIVCIIAVLFLVINFLFAPHNPYQEKFSIFECGFHSFLGQNRSQFSISFFIYALVYLLLDLEILLMFPFAVSENQNGIYGLLFTLCFIVIITIGFIFELGKSALKIDSKQKLSEHNIGKSSNTSISYFTKKGGPKTFMYNKIHKRSYSTQSGKQIDLFNINLVARNSHRPEIMMSQSVMVGRLDGFSYATGRGSIAHGSTFITPSLAVTPFQNNIRLFKYTNLSIGKYYYSSFDKPLSKSLVISSQKKYHINTINNIIFNDNNIAVVSLSPIHDITRIYREYFT